MIKMKRYIYVNGWKEKIRFSSAHVIPEYEKCGRLHGHTYAIHAKIYGEVDDKGIILDFKLVKEILNEITLKLDHKILIPKNSKFAQIKVNENSVIMKTLGKIYNFPIEDCILLPIESTSAEILSEYILKLFYKQLKKYDNLNCIEIGVDEGFGQGSRAILKI
jgi:6-pyruvoyltetrahydropterin/6-carboxytetrahydropterin synthase